MNKISTVGELCRLVGILEAEVSNGVSILVDWKLWKPSRTNYQNNYLFGVCYPLLSDAMGYDVNDLHEYFCGTHFGWVDKKCPKKPHNAKGLESVPFRTTTRNSENKSDVLGKVAFGEFVATVHRVAGKANVFIPDPDPSLRS